MPPVDVPTMRSKTSAIALGASRRSSSARTAAGMIPRIPPPSIASTRKRTGHRSHTTTAPATVPPTWNGGNPAGSESARALLDHEALDARLGVRELRVEPLELFEEELRDGVGLDPVPVGRHHVPGAQSVEVSARASSYAARYSSKRARTSRSARRNFQRFSGWSIRSCRRLRCSSFETLRKTFTSAVPSSTSIRSHSRMWPGLRRQTSSGASPSDAYGDDVLVVRAIEDRDLATHRKLGVDAPQEVVGELRRRRRLERDDPASLRAEAGEHRADDTVLPRRVQSLENEEHAPRSPPRRVGAGGRRDGRGDR